MEIISGSGSFRGRFGDHFRVGDHFGVGIISRTVQTSLFCMKAEEGLYISLLVEADFTHKNVFKIKHRWLVICNKGQNSFARFLFILWSRNSFAKFNF